MAMNQDRYVSFSELRRSELEGVDFRIVCLDRDSQTAIIAPHGGLIEPGTSEVAARIAGDMHRLYCFEGLRDRPHTDLHITSHRFDEPRCLELVGLSDQVVTIHGRVGGERSLDIGGLDKELQEDIRASLVEAGFAARLMASGLLAGTDRNNICNRGRRGLGVQLEISRGLRDALMDDAQLLERFASAVRRAF